MREECNRQAETASELAILLLRLRAIFVALGEHETKVDLKPM
jgi:hypothetical protein